jgi:hypothetical protein
MRPTLLWAVQGRNPWVVVALAVPCADPRHTPSPKAAVETPSAVALRRGWPSRLGQAASEVGQSLLTLLLLTPEFYVALLGLAVGLAVSFATLSDRIASAFAALPF